MTVDTDEKCQCGHSKHNHFKAEDALGRWEFCMISDCNCFIDFRNEEDGSAQTG